MESMHEHRDALYSMEEGRDGEVYEEPHGEFEQALAQVWRDTFRLEKIGRNDNFFGLGGNSLLGMELTELLANRLGIEVPVVLLFQYPSVREMAEAISTLEENEARAIEG
jgi:acyl carrier protein